MIPNLLAESWMPIFSQIYFDIEDSNTMKKFKNNNIN